MASGCFLHINQPMWAKKNPLFALWGSALVSLNLWWARWLRAHTKILSCPESVWAKAMKSFSGNLALKDRWDHNRWAPAPVPNPPIKYKHSAWHKFWNNLEWIIYKMKHLKLRQNNVPQPRVGHSASVKQRHKPYKAATWKQTHIITFLQAISNGWWSWSIG